MKPRAKHLHEVLMGRKPGRHKDKRQRHILTEEEKQVKEYKYRLKQLRETEYTEE